MMQNSANTIYNMEICYFYYVFKKTKILNLYEKNKK